MFRLTGQISDLCTTAIHAQLDPRNPFLAGTHMSPWVAETHCINVQRVVRNDPCSSILRWEWEGLFSQIFSMGCVVNSAEKKKTSKPSGATSPEGISPSNRLFYRWQVGYHKWETRVYQWWQVPRSINSSSHQAAGLRNGAESRKFLSDRARLSEYRSWNLVPINTWSPFFLEIER